MPNEGSMKSKDQVLINVESEKMVCEMIFDRERDTLKASTIFLLVRIKPIKFPY